MGARLLYIGLWNFADDAGVFEWHTRLLRSQIFPFDDGVNVDCFLSELLLHGRIKKFAYNGKEYGLIINFTKYQKPDSRYLKYTIGNYEHVKIISHSENPTSSLGEPTTDSDSDGVIVIEANKPFRKNDDPETTGKKFVEIIVSEQWCDQPYADKTISQAGNLSAKNKEEFYRKCRVIIHCYQSNSESTRKLAKKMFHEIAGFVNDHGAMERVLSGKELAERRKIAGEPCSTFEPSE